MLAIVDGLGTGFVGGGATAEKGPSLEQAHRVTRAAEGGSRRKAGQPAADHDHFGHESDVARNPEPQPEEAVSIDFGDNPLAYRNWRPMAAAPIAVDDFEDQPYHDGDE